MRIVIVSIIIILFVGLNLYIRISTLKYYKEFTNAYDVWSGITVI